MALNMSSARSFNSSRGYDFHALNAIQRQVGAERSGAFDDNTIRRVAAWQSSADRLISLVPDGKLGNNSLGCMIAEMRRGSPTTDLAALTHYPHNLPNGNVSGDNAIVTSFTVQDLQKLELKGDGAGWQFRGRFRVNIRLNDNLSNPNRYQYRQYIRGVAVIQYGSFTGNPPSVGNWRASGRFEDAGKDFKIPGGLKQHAWTEDGLVTGATTRKYGYRSANAFIAVGEEDRYQPDQKNGKEYICVDTYGLMGTSRVSGSWIRISLHYKGVVIDTLTSNRVIKEKTWSYYEEDIMV